MGVSRRLTTSIAWLLLASACSVPAPAEILAPSDGLAPTESTAPIESPSPVASEVAPSASPSIVPPGDPAAELTGRAVAGIATGGPDVVMRIGAGGFRLPEDEFVIEVYDDRVLTGKRSGTEPPSATLVVRDLENNVLREIQPGMQIPQTAIVRGDDVYFAGVDITYDEQGQIEGTIDRGVWVARGDGPPEPIYAPKHPVIYSRLQLSPDASTIGFTRCDDACTTTIVRPGSTDVVDVPVPELIALANEAVLVIAPSVQTNQVIAYAIADGRELWRAAKGVYWERYATSDGTSFVISASERLEGTGEELRLDVFDALSGTIERTAKVADAGRLPWLTPSLSTDRYAAILGTIVPNPDEGPHSVRVVDLQTGTLLDLQLTLGDVPG